MPPNSTDAQVFLQFSSPPAPSVSNTPMEASSATPVDTRRIRKLLGASILSGSSILLYCLIVSMLIIISIW
ncbi:hypothetical protein RJ641_027341 [Dillenia turbinata]|uniref:Uncharacterized protein n=1 Tax=Dillenia turbinata TaxID=194707 RepID=A0AAN8VX96_9MAGN